MKSAMRVNCPIVAWRKEVAPAKAAPNARTCSGETGPVYSAVRFSDSASKSEASHSPRAGLDVHVLGEHLQELPCFFNHVRPFVEWTPGERRFSSIRMRKRAISFLPRASRRVHGAR